MSAIMLSLSHTHTHTLSLSLLLYLYLSEKFYSTGHCHYDRKTFIIDATELTIYFWFQVILGMVEDETDRYFSDSEISGGFGPDVRDKYLRTLVRNTYSYHLNEIYATVQGPVLLNLLRP